MGVSPVLLVLAASGVLGPAAPAAASLTSGPTDLCTTLRQPDTAPHELLALIEIPAGGQVKYELHEESGRMEVDRFLSMPVAYPVNYGILPCTLADDGDHLDVLVLTRLPVLPGGLIRVRPVGVLRMLDRGERDDKILMVPVSAVDPTYDGVRSLEDLPAAELQRVEAFFQVYKNLPDPTAQVEVGPWEGVESALALIRAALVVEVPGG